MIGSSGFSEKANIQLVDTVSISSGGVSYKIDDSDQENSKSESDSPVSKKKTLRSALLGSLKKYVSDDFFQKSKGMPSDNLGKELLTKRSLKASNVILEKSSDVMKDAQKMFDQSQITEQQLKEKVVLSKNARDALGHFQDKPSSSTFLQPSLEAQLSKNKKSLSLLKEEGELKMASKLSLNKKTTSSEVYSEELASKKKKSDEVIKKKFDKEQVRLANFRADTSASVLDSEGFDGENGKTFVKKRLIKKTEKKQVKEDLLSKGQINSQLSGVKVAEEDKDRDLKKLKKKIFSKKTLNQQNGLSALNKQDALSVNNKELPSSTSLSSENLATSDNEQLIKQNKNKFIFPVPSEHHLSKKAQITSEPSSFSISKTESQSLEGEGKRVLEEKKEISDKRPISKKIQNEQLSRYMRVFSSYAFKTKMGESSRALSIEKNELRRELLKNGMSEKILIELEAKTLKEMMHTLKYGLGKDALMRVSLDVNSLDGRKKLTQHELHIPALQNILGENTLDSSDVSLELNSTFIDGILSFFVHSFDKNTPGFENIDILEYYEKVTHTMSKFVDQSELLGLFRNMLKTMDDQGLCANWKEGKGLHPDAIMKSKIHISDEEAQKKSGFGLGNFSKSRKAKEDDIESYLFDETAILESGDLEAIKKFLKNLYIRKCMLLVKGLKNTFKLNRCVSNVEAYLLKKLGSSELNGIKDESKKLAIFRLRLALRESFELMATLTELRGAEFDHIKVELERIKKALGLLGKPVSHQELNDLRDESNKAVYLVLREKWLALGARGKNNSDLMKVRDRYYIIMERLKKESSIEDSFNKGLLNKLDFLKDISIAEAA